MIKILGLHRMKKLRSQAWTESMPILKTIRTYQYMFQKHRE